MTIPLEPVHTTYMLDQVIGLVLLGLGLRSDVHAPAVLGDENRHEAPLVSPTGTPKYGWENRGRNGSPSFQPNADDTLTPHPFEDREVPNHTIPSRRGSTPSGEPRGTRELEPIRMEIRDAYRVELHERLATMEEHMRERRDAIETALADKKKLFEERLAQFRDQHRQQTVAQLQNRLTNLNDTVIASAKKQIEKISSVLEETIAKKDALVAAGKDTTTLTSLIATAKTALQKAQDALTLQAGRTYVVPLVSEATARTDVGGTLSQFTADRKVLFSAITQARKAVSDCIRELARLRGEAVPDAVIR